MKPVLNKAEYLEAVSDYPLGDYWTEIQVLRDGRFDVVSAKWHIGFVSNKPEIYRWYHSVQYGYWNSLEAALAWATCGATGKERPIHILKI